MTLSAIRDEVPNRRALSAGSPQRAVTDLGEERVSCFEDMGGQLHTQGSPAYWRVTFKTSPQDFLI
jgi:hypothetical protein